MKRIFDYYIINNSPNHIIQIANYIIQKQNIELLLNFNDISYNNIDNIYDIIYNLNLILENKLNKTYEDKKYINYIYKYENSIFKLQLKYSEEKIYIN